MSNPISGFSKLSKTQKIAWLSKILFKGKHTSNTGATKVLELRHCVTKAT